MTANIQFYIGSIAIALWGLAHIIPTKSIVDGIGELSIDNHRVIIMQWVAEDLTLIFIGLLVLAATLVIGPSSPSTEFFCYAAAGMLIVMAVWRAFTGARTSILPMKA